MPGQDGDVHLRSLGAAAFHRFCHFLRRSVGIFSRDGPDKDFDEFRPVAHVDVMQLPAKGDLIAPSRSQQVGVGVAADVTQKSLMIDAARVSGQASQSPRSASPAHRSAKRNPASGRWPGRSRTPTSSKNQRVEPLVPSFRAAPGVEKRTECTSNRDFVDRLMPRLARLRRRPSSTAAVTSAFTIVLPSL